MAVAAGGADPQGGNPIILELLAGVQKGVAAVAAGVVEACAAFGNMLRGLGGRLREELAGMRTARTPSHREGRPEVS